MELLQSFLAKINGLVDNDLSEMNLGEALDALNEPAVWWKAFTECLANVIRQITDDHSNSKTTLPKKQKRGGYRGIG